MTLVSLLTATAWVDFVVIVLSKFVHLTNALGTWYADFGMNAVGSDVLIIVLGIYLVQLLFPGIHGWNLVAGAVSLQIIHDILFYFGVILGVPEGQNKIIDLFRRYAGEGSWKIILADSIMVASSVLLMEYLDNNVPDKWIAFLGLLALYSLIYIVYTK
jgi:hypothetical protein